MGWGFRNSFGCHGFRLLNGADFKRTVVILTRNEDDGYNLLLSSKSRADGGFSVGTSQAAKAASHDRILDIAAARIRRDGIDNLSVDELMKEAGLTHGGFYRHFGSREQLVAEAAQRALTLGSAWTIAAGQLGGARGYTALVDGYLSARHRDHPESGCGVAGVAADVARAGGSARASYTRQVQECLAVISDLIDNPDRQVGEREAVVTLSVLVGAISMARAVDDPEVSRQILTNAAAVLKERSPSEAGSRRRRNRRQASGV
jgi:TetR/AcrR family transcriptional regulator, transcriptional repressor for nem operon